MKLEGPRDNTTPYANRFVRVDDAVHVPEKAEVAGGLMTPHAVLAENDGIADKLGGEGDTVDAGTIEVNPTRKEVVLSGESFTLNIPKTDQQDIARARTAQVVTQIFPGYKVVVRKFIA
jgi:hypothetical protein